MRKLKVLKSNGRAKAGAIVYLKCDENGMPIDNFYYRRVLDMPTDKNCEWIQEEKKNEPNQHPDKKDQPKKQEKEKVNAN